jgi:hypothetical protein
MIGIIFWEWAEADRFGILNDYSPYNFIVNPNKRLFSPQLTSKSISEIMDSVADKVLNLSTKKNQSVVVLWSGGVDSTAIVCALIKAGIRQDQLILLYTDYSIKEYPKMYDFLRKSKYRMIKFTWKSQSRVYDYIPNSLIVTGWCADQLFGSNVNQFYPNEFNKPFKDGITNILNTFNNFDKHSLDRNLDLFEHHAKKVGVELKYTCDALWWFNFSIKWSHVSMDLSMNIRNKEQRANIINFFEDEEFQSWSISNYQEFYKYPQIDPKSYKKELKQYIYDFNKDEDYLITKGKVGSWGKNGTEYFNYGDMCIVDTQGYHFKDLTEKTPWSENLLHQHYKQDVNRMYHLLDYLKPSVDIENIKYAFTKERKVEYYGCFS